MFSVNIIDIGRFFTFFVLFCGFSPTSYESVRGLDRIYPLTELPPSSDLSNFSVMLDWDRGKSQGFLRLVSS